MKKIIYILLILLPLVTTAQEEKKESKQSKYKSLEKRSISLDRNVPELLKEARDVMHTDPQLALSKVEEALALSITEESSFDQAQCFTLLGAINLSIKEWRLAIENYNKAYQRLSRAYTNTPEFMEVLTGLGNAFGQLGDHNAALKYFNFKLKVSQNAADEATAHLDIAEARFNLGEYDRAQQAVSAAEELSYGANSKLITGRLQAIKAKLLAQTNDLEAAEDLYVQSQSLDFEDDSDNTDNEAILESTKKEIINAYRGQNRVADEIQFRNRNIESNLLKGKPLEVSKEKREIGKVLIDYGETFEAIAQLEDAVKLADSVGDANELADNYQSLAKAYQKVGRNNDALQAYSNFSRAVEKVNEETLKEQQEKADLLKKQKDIEAMVKDLALDVSEYQLGVTSSQLRDNKLWLQRIAIYGLLGLLVVAVVASYSIYRNARKTKTMSQMLALKSLRSQMNPHFIFNALNSVNQFVAKNDERAANKFLTEFSKLMRLVLDSSQKDFITLQEEKEILSLYLKLEHYRFRDKFDYEFTIDEDLSLETVDVPPMLIQPYVENAIWHGLRYKEDQGHLKVLINKDGGMLQITVSDDGIGRKRSMELKTENQKKHNSTGLKNIDGRIGIINEVYKKRYDIEINDFKEGGSGTIVRIRLPIDN